MNEMLKYDVMIPVENNKKGHVQWSTGRGVEGSHPSNPLLRITDSPLVTAA